MTGAADQNQGDVQYAEAASAALARASESLHQAVELSKEIGTAFDWYVSQARWLDSQAPVWHDRSGQALIRNAKDYAGDLADSLDRVGDRRFDQLDRHLSSAGDAIRTGQESLARVSELPERCVDAARLIDDRLGETWIALQNAQPRLDRTREHIKAARETVQRVIDLPDSSVDVARVAQASFQVRGAAVTAMDELRGGRRMFSHLTGKLLDMEGVTEDVADLAKTVARNVEAEAANRGSGRPSPAVRAASTRRLPGHAGPASGRMRGAGDDSTQKRGVQQGGHVR